MILDFAKYLLSQSAMMHIVNFVSKGDSLVSVAEKGLRLQTYQHLVKVISAQARPNCKA